MRGEVNRLDSFYYAKGMQVQDAILMAGGYKDGASKKLIEVARRIRDTTSNVESLLFSIILSVEVSNTASKDALNKKLETFDIISVRKAPGYKEQVSVAIEGEVIYPDSYTIISNHEHLSDLVKRAGGLKKGDYAPSAFLFRKTFENLSVTDTVILKNKLATLKSTFNDTATDKDADSTLKDDMKIVGIRQDSVLNNSGSIDDVILQKVTLLKYPRR